jgi:hypothetical protein
MTVRRRLGVAALALCLLPSAQAHASGNDVLKDCSTNGRLTKNYSQQEYRDAIANIPSDLDEYTDCRDRIRAAQLGLSGGGDDPSGGLPTTPAGNRAARDPFAGASEGERLQVMKDVAAARKNGRASQRVADGVVTPGALANHDLTAVSELPMPLAILALLVGVGALSLLIRLVLRRDRTRARAA